MMRLSIELVLRGLIWRESVRIKIAMLIGKWGLFSLGLGLLIYYWIIKILTVSYAGNM